MHVAAFHLRLVFDDRYILKIVRQTLQNAQTLFRVRHFATAEHDGDLNLGTCLQEANYMLLLVV